MFEIIGFGSNFEISSKNNGNRGYVNCDENVEKILKEIDWTYKADMGGTDILKPMQFAMNTNYLSSEDKI
jgi:hypothetical protein